MGNEQSGEKRRAPPASPGLDTPPRKRAKLLRGSLSLRSLRSLASSSANSSTDTDNSRKRKHDCIPQSPSTQSMVLSVERHWPSLMFDGFEPDFPWRTDITESDFILLNVVGSGRFGQVYRASPRKRVKEQVAIKVQRKVDILKAGAEDQIRNEVRVQKYLPKNQFVAEFIDAWQTQSELFTLMEYVDGYGDLFTLWSDYGQFNEDLVRLYSTEIALGLQFLHDNNLIHRDLKMENLALDIKMHVKFVDFGFAKHLEPKGRTQTVCGTLQYMAPEVAKCRPYDLAVDWWSFGVVVYVMRTGYYPFPNNNVANHEELVFEQHEYPDCCTNEFRTLVAKLLTIDPTHRLRSAQALFTDRFYNAVNIEGIASKDVCPWELLKNETKLRCPNGSEPPQSGYSEHYSRLMSFNGFDETIEHHMDHQ